MTAMKSLDTNTVIDAVLNTIATRTDPKGHAVLLGCIYTCLCIKTAVFPVQTLVFTFANYSNTFIISVTLTKKLKMHIIASICPSVCSHEKKKN
jgi:hypothetical protein